MVEKSRILILGASKEQALPNPDQQVVDSTTTNPSCCLRVNRNRAISQISLSLSNLEGIG
jgi:hypothetical protein